MNILEISEVVLYIDSLEDSPTKELLKRMQLEHEKYRKIGTPGQCEDYKEYCKMSVLEVLQMMWNTNKALKDEIDCLKRYYEKELKEQNNRGKRGMK